MACVHSVEWWRKDGKYEVSTKAYTRLDSKWHGQPS